MVSEGTRKHVTSWLYRAHCCVSLVTGCLANTHRCHSRCVRKNGPAYSTTTERYFWAIANSLDMMKLDNFSTVLMEETSWLAILFQNKTKSTNFSQAQHNLALERNNTCTRLLTMFTYWYVFLCESAIDSAKYSLSPTTAPPSATPAGRPFFTPWPKYFDFSVLPVPRASSFKYQPTRPSNYHRLAFDLSELWPDTIRDPHSCKN